MNWGDLPYRTVSEALEVLSKETTLTARAQGELVEAMRSMKEHFTNDVVKSTIHEALNPALETLEKSHRLAQENADYEEDDSFGSF